MRVDPYLYFEGRCEEAIEFYRKAVGAEVAALVRFKEGGVPSSPGHENKIMHAELRIGDCRLLASDGQCRGTQAFQGFALALSVGNPDDAARHFSALGDGGRVLVPLAPTPFAQGFGMLADRFGVSWTVVAQ